MGISSEGRRAFVAETLLFDHLLVPVPAEEEQDAYMNWEHRRWEPKEALETVEVLGDLAIPVPWSETLRDRYRDRYGRALLGEDAKFDFENIKLAPDDAPER